MDDPIFAAIETHRAAGQGDAAAAVALLDVEPCTIAGAIALMRYACDPDVAWPGDRVADVFDDSSRAFLQVLIRQVVEALEQLAMALAGDRGTPERPGGPQASTGSGPW